MSEKEPILINGEAPQGLLSEIPERQLRVFNEALAIMEEDARSAGAVGYMARVLTQATIPHSRQKGNEYVRRNGHFTLSILSPSHVGLPYGTVPRLLLNWITTEAFKTKSPELFLGESLSAFMKEIGYKVTGGERGTITSFKAQVRKLFASSVFWSYDDRGKNGAGPTWADLSIKIAKRHMLWWDPKDPGQASLFQSSVTLSDDFFREIIERPIPVDMRVIKSLRQSPLALDLYCWLTYRMFILKKTTVVPWEALRMQFGADYSRERAFKENLLRQMNRVLQFYPEARLEAVESGLKLYPSRPSVQVLSPK